MREFFIENYSINPKNIYTIMDRRATKRNILKALKKISDKTPDGKKIIVYFS